MKIWKIKRNLIEDAFETASITFPKEFMCLLSGDIKTMVINEIVVGATYTSQNSASIDLNTIPFDETIVGSIHSHPNNYCYPSKADKRFFLRYKINIIIGVGEKGCTGVYDSFGNPLPYELID